MIGANIRRRPWSARTCHGYRLVRLRTVLRPGRPTEFRELEVTQPGR